MTELTNEALAEELHAHANRSSSDGLWAPHARQLMDQAADRLGSVAAPLDGLARELLATVYEAGGNKAAAFTLRKVGAVGIKLEAEVRALDAALATRLRSQPVRELTRLAREEIVRQQRDDDRSKCAAGSAFFDEEVSPYLIVCTVLAALGLAAGKEG